MNTTKIVGSELANCEIVIIHQEPSSEVNGYRFAVPDDDVLGPLDWLSSGYFKQGCWLNRRAVLRITRDGERGMH